MLQTDLKKNIELVKQHENATEQLSNQADQQSKTILVKEKALNELESKHELMKRQMDETQADNDRYEVECQEYQKTIQELKEESKKQLDQMLKEQ